MGHKNRMKSIRMEWIDEGKPRSSVHEGSIFDDPAMSRREDEDREKTSTGVAPIFEKTATGRPKTPIAYADNEMDDIYDATPRPVRQQPPEIERWSGSLLGGEKSLFGPSKNIVDDGPPGDDLDALLAEEEMLQASSGNVQHGLPVTKAPAAQEVNFDAEMEAMAEMDDMW